LVHPSVQQDALTAARHRAFIGPRLLGSLAALAAFPIYLIMRGAPSLLEVVVLAWLVTPILVAYFLSRTGRYESAHVLSSLSLTGLVTVVAIATGGIGSFAAIWLVVVPLEAAWSASRRVVAVASTFALGAAGLLLIMGAFDGGHLGIASRLGEGTRVTFDLPVNCHSARGGETPLFEQFVPRACEQSASIRVKKSA
jgi:two-component system, cell cycle sensor histidine kinase DivJ